MRGEARFEALDLNDRIALVHALDEAVHDRLVLREEFREDLFAFGVAQALQDHLLGVLSKTAAGGIDVHVFNGALDVVARLKIREFVMNVGEHFLTIGFLKALLIGHDEPAAHGGEFARGAVDAHENVGIFTGEAGALHGARERNFEDAEDDVLFDVLFAGEHVDELEHFTAVHFFITP